MLKKFTDYVQIFGSQSQKDRLAEGYSLPDAEVDEVVYHAIWESYRGYYKRRRLTEDEVREIAIMHRMAGPDDPVTFEVVEPADELSAVQWKVYKAIQDIAEDFDAKVTPFWVIGHCGRKKLKKTYARVEFVLEERPYRIELCLEPPKLV
jgi:hypothetical protein